VSQTQHAAFEPGKASVAADGLLKLSGTVRSVPGQSGGAYSFIFAFRGSNAEREYPAWTSEGPDGATKVSCAVPLADLGTAPDDFVDLYFQSRHASGAARTRLTWQSQSLRWLPYPTKFGNISLKRKAL
jgi:hypothetical protein